MNDRRGGRPPSSSSVVVVVAFFAAAAAAAAASSFAAASSSTSTPSPASKFRPARTTTTTPRRVVVVVDASPSAFAPPPPVVAFVAPRGPSSSSSSSPRGARATTTTTTTSLLASSPRRPGGEDDDEDESWPDVLDEADDDGRREDVVLYSDEAEEEDEPPRRQSVPWKKNARWNSLKPEVRTKMIEEGRRRATERKRGREPSADKKRRLLNRYEESRRKKKLALRVKRPTPFRSPTRVPLSTLTPGTELNGTVISLTSFGAYVDVNTEVDGLLHVSQLTREEFVEHPRQFLSPGETVEVRVVRSSDELKKLQLTMLPPEYDSFDLSSSDEEDDEDESEEEDRISLDDIEVDDELWGEIVRVTSYGSYVEWGGEVQGFLHFMDHPSFNVIPGSTPKEFMRVGDRVRVWALDVDRDRDRVKLTGNRPVGLPGPRWERRGRAAPLEQGEAQAREREGEGEGQCNAMPRDERKRGNRKEP